MLDNPPDLGYADTMDINEKVENALAGNYGLRVKLDSGIFALFGNELAYTWDNLNSGEGFKILEVLR